MQVMPFVAVTILDLDITFLNLTIRFLPHQVIDAIHHDVEVPHGSCLTLIDGDNGEVVAGNGHIERIAQTTVVLTFHQLLVHPGQCIIIDLVPTASSDAAIIGTCANLIIRTHTIVALLGAEIPALVQVHIRILLGEVLYIRFLDGYLFAFVDDIGVIKIRVT